ECREKTFRPCVAIASNIDSCGNSKCEATALAKAFAPVGGAAAQVVTETKTLTAQVGISPLERLGIRKSAEDGAAMKCQEQGLLGCVVMGSEITACEGSECKATAAAVGFKAEGKKEQKPGPRIVPI
ncbi:MAG: hypothetical protein PHF00_09360, partial [Elusimicrobia bacterium]|nr:hypothetical protein [Elusimicrobiota bacterium]